MDLVLVNVTVVDEVFSSMMPTCHTLHYLYLVRCDKLKNLRTYHAQLVSVDVYRCRRLRSISIHAEKLKSFSYTGGKVNIEYECAPVLCKLGAIFVEHSILPVGCNFIGASPMLEMLHLQFPSRLQVSRILQHNGRFTGLKELMLSVLTSWKKSIRFVAYLLKAAPLVEILELQAHGNPRPLKKLKIRWPKNFTHTKLSTIRIGGFSGDMEMVQLVFFLLSRSSVLTTLLIDTHPREHRGLHRWERVEVEDAMRCNYAREVASTHLAPNIPSTVKFRIM